MPDDAPAPKRKRTYGRRPYDRWLRQWLQRALVVIGAAVAALPGVDWYERQAMQKVLYQVEAQKAREAELKMRELEKQIEEMRKAKP